MGNKAVGKAELYIVGIKLTILMVFIVGGVWTLQWQNIKPDLDGSHLGQLVNASVIFFLSYMGFGIITNASENIKNPKQNVRRAIYASITVVILIYVLIAVVTLGNLPLSTIISAKENALAIAAKPFLGPAGFFLISIGALFSISSALNASIFGGANIAYSLAKDGELPPFFERKVWFKSTEGLYITAGLGLTFALIFNLGAIATITSSVLTVVYLFVVVAHLRMCDQYGGNRTVLRFNFLLLVAVFVALMLYQWQSHRGAFYGSIVTFAGAFSLELFLRKVMKRNFTEHHKDNFKTRHEQVVHEQSSGTEDRH
ncbi:MAG: APC family permease [Saprospiraceae bacterium]